MKTLQVYKPKRRYIPKVVKHEESLQKQVCHYLRLQYPHVIFRSDFASGLHLTEYQAKTHKSLQSGRSWPDLFVYEPRTVVMPDGSSRKFYGLAIELKRDGTTIYNKIGPRKGLITADAHIQEQALLLQELNKRGYFARFGVGFDNCQRIIDWYFGKEKAPENSELF